MLRFIVVSVVVATAGGLLAAPVPPDAKALVAKLSDPDEKVRDESAAALKGRTDAMPWLRRAARSKAPITAARAANLLEPHEKQRQEVVAKAIDACIRDGCIDLLTEWHQYWKPPAEEDLWPVGPRAAKAGVDLFAKSCPKATWERFEKEMAWAASVDTKVHNGPSPDRFEVFKGAWLIRTDRLDGRAHALGHVSFASVAGPVRLSTPGGRYLVLGPVEGSKIAGVFVACDGGIGAERRVQTTLSFIVCRGNFTGGDVNESVLLVDGDIDLTRTTALRNCLIRATGAIRLPVGGIPKDERPAAICTIEAGVKNATAPYKFFELSDVGVSVVEDKDGVVVTAVKANTPFGDCGLQKGDLIRAIDDAPAGHSEPFRKAVRRALVRQGDCLLTVVRGDKTLDLPVFFPLPK